MIQQPMLILPTAFDYPDYVNMETVADLVTHTSTLIDTSPFLQEKTLHVVCMEVVGVGPPGPLWCWVEIAYAVPGTTPWIWGAIGGGGGVYPPLTPIIVVATGVPFASQLISIPWTVHSFYARLVVQTPVNAGLPDDYWAVQGWFEAKG